MRSRLSAFACLILVLAVTSVLLRARLCQGSAAQPPSIDPDLARGELQVEEGDFAAGIATLKKVAQRLASGDRAKELAVTYVYLGIAYLQTGQRTRAKDAFLIAHGKDSALDLTSHEFPRKVVEFWDETIKKAPPAPAGQKAPAPTSASTEVKGGEAIAGVSQQERENREAAEQHLRAAEAMAAEQREGVRGMPAGAVRDPQTGLVWTQSDNGSNINWEQARSYCNDLSLGAYRDWALPTIEQLEKLYDQTRSIDEMCSGYYCHPRLGIHLSAPLVWSITEDRSEAAWSVIFFLGSRLSSGRSASVNERALCVRRSGG